MLACWIGAWVSGSKYGLTILVYFLDSWGLYCTHLDCLYFVFMDQVLRPRSLLYSLSKVILQAM